MLARMILCLSGVKLLQKKSDRDWIFLYLMAFFEVLLGAGLSISALYLVSFLAYLLVLVCAIIAFEIRRTSRLVERTIAGIDAATRAKTSEPKAVSHVRRLPLVSFALILLIGGLAIPLFFALPRVGGAGFGGDQRGLSTFSGFSDRVTLGQFGTIQKDNSVVMRVKLDGDIDNAAGLYFRGIALDTFDNRTWSRSKAGQQEARRAGDGGVILLDKISGRNRLFAQTIYLEPLDTPVLFALPRAVGIEGNFQFVNKDAYGAISHTRSSERISYRVFSDRHVPAASVLRSDSQQYLADSQNYRTLPGVYDLRIAELAARITAGAANRYDKARAVESYLQANFGYTLEQKASGREPLSDFLFNVREGHCEYFATAMAILLRTQGIATRVVNGFHGGEFNDAAGVTIVRQSNAHAWVEVYFPQTDSWVSFDPTPFAGQNTSPPTGFTAAFTKYLEAIETFWIQNFVAFDNQEQQSLARNARSGFAGYQQIIASYLGVTRDIAAEWLAEVRGDNGRKASLIAVGYAAVCIVALAAGIFVLRWSFGRLLKSRIWKRLRERLRKRPNSPIIRFYEEMIEILTARGVTRNSFQTPLEFAAATGIPEAVAITEKYHKVRFGDLSLSPQEAAEVQSLLDRLRNSSSVSV